jgi:hypothetical protein
VQTLLLIKVLYLKKYKNTFVVAPDILEIQRIHIMIGTQTTKEHAQLIG